MLILAAVGHGSDIEFGGTVEVDEPHQREGHKGSREWLLHRPNPSLNPRPPRHQWYVYNSGRVKMKRGPSRWQLPRLAITDRSGHRFLERIKNRSNLSATPPSVRSLQRMQSFALTVQRHTHASRHRTEWCIMS